MKTQKIVSICLLTFLLLGLIGNLQPFNVKPVQASTVDLDALLLSKWQEYLAWMARYYDLNGTSVDVRDYSQYAAGASKITLSVPIYLISIMNMYEQTRDTYYLSLLQVYVDNVIDNSINYVDVAGIGEIFHAIHYYYAGSDKDHNLHQTAEVAIICVKLYSWTRNIKYKALADRVANESLNHLPVFNNSTDLAWSCNYYSDRDEAHAKTGVNRQGIMAWFYALYGKEINSTYSSYVPKIVNWIWRAQIANGGLEYSIGGGTVNEWYSACAVYKVLNAYLVDSSTLNSTYKTKIINTLGYVHDGCRGMYDYQKFYFQTMCFVTAWKTDYFIANISIPRTKAMLYAALNSFHLTDTGFVSNLGGLSFGFRWSQYTLAHLFMGYKLPDATLDLSTLNPITTDKFDTAKHYLVGFTGASFANYIRDGLDYYGLCLDYGTSRAFYMEGDGTFGSLASPSSLTNDTYYVMVNATFGSDDILFYVYPTGVSVGEVTGTNTPCLRLDDSNDWKLRVSNGTEYQINSWSSGSNYILDTDILVWKNTTALSDRRTFLIHAPTNDWNYTLATQLKLKFTTEETDYRVVLVELLSWGDLIPDATTAYSTLKTIAEAYNTTQPLSYSTMFDTYHNQVTSLKPEASWNTVYESAQSTTPKLIGHNLPEQVSLTAWEYAGGKLTYSILGNSGTTSTTKIYCGSEGKPSSVTGTKYDPETDYSVCTKILTLTVEHSSSATIEVNWGSAASGLFNLMISVLKDGYPTQAIVNLQGENRSIYGLTRFELPYGTYDITVYCDGVIQTKQVGISNDMNVGFNFESASEPLNPAVLAVPITIILAVALFIFLRRKH